MFESLLTEKEDSCLLILVICKISVPMPIKSFGSNPATSDTTILVEAPVVAKLATVFAKPTSFFFTFKSN